LTTTPLNTNEQAAQQQNIKEPICSVFSTATNTHDKRFCLLQGGGRWFEPSITHSEKAVFCRCNMKYEKGPDETLALFDTSPQGSAIYTFLMP
jgi:hypothetical protein